MLIIIGQKLALKTLLFLKGIYERLVNCRGVIYPQKYIVRLWSTFVFYELLQIKLFYQFC
jgi:hypothetical protein